MLSIQLAYSQIQQKLLKLIKDPLLIFSMEGVRKLSSYVLGQHKDGNLLSPTSLSPEIDIPSPKLAKEVRILTYNIFLRPPLIKTNKNDHKNSRVDEFLKLIEKYDVICLQEAFGFWNKRKQKLVRLTQKLGFAYFAESPNPPIFSTYGIDGGLVVVSRYPIAKAEFHCYPASILGDSIAMKGVLYTKISVSDNSIHLFSTHTQATHNNRFDAETFIARGDQFLSFRQFIDKIIPRHYCEGDVAILCGDFNVNSRNPDFEVEKVKGDYIPFELYPFLQGAKTFNEYEVMVTCLSKNKTDDLVDLLYDNLGYFPPTYGVSVIGEDGVERPDEIILTHAVDHCTNLCLDYMFQIIPKAQKQQEQEQQHLEITLKDSPARLRHPIKLTVKKEGSTVEKFYVKHPKVTQLSDHFGLMCTIEVVGINDE